MMIGWETNPDYSADVVGLKADVLKDAYNEESSCTTDGTNEEIAKEEQQIWAEGNDEYLKDNMFTKYQMIKFIDFCEVSFLPESVARVAAINGDHRYHTPRH
ncbi:hypothetical protein TNCV_3407561 [Trichonephila clavipes]|uniref:Uncharacterized protein n=1 Tax=Trichonephila clavipes TaxID=2585209 RepID=A0A8X6UUJ1_TRICX|nr:hypothetical protein TNCV_3407561 [Trichonephila clavipes]